MGWLKDNWLKDNMFITYIYYQINPVSICTAIKLFH